MKKTIAIVFLLVSSNIFSILEIEILKGSDNLSKIAFVPFGVEDDIDEDYGIQISNLIEKNMLLFAEFENLDKSEMLSYPAKEEDFFYRDWKVQGVDFSLNEKWQKLADCRVKQGAAVPLYVNQDEINKDNDRIVAWNWCSLNDGVSYEDLIAEHDKRAKILEEDSLGIIAWANLFPRIGTDQAPGDFAHIAVYPNVEAAQIYQQAQSDGGWKDYRDYQTDFATCRGEAFMIEQVINNPNS